MTYSIAARDKETDQIGILMTTMTAVCGSIMKNYAEKAEAVFACQAFSEYGSGARYADLLDEGMPFSDVIKLMEEKDDYLSFKQIGIVPRHGDIEVYTGESCMDWAGHIIGDDYLVFGNFLAGEHVATAMAQAFEESHDKELSERLLIAAEAGQKAGGQAYQGHSMPELSTFLRVHDYKADPFIFAEGRAPVLDIRVDLDIDPVAKLRRLYGPICTLMEDYKKRYGVNPEKYVEEAVVPIELEMVANQW